MLVLATTGFSVSPKRQLQTSLRSAQSPVTTLWQKVVANYDDEMFKLLDDEMDMGGSNKKLGINFGSQLIPMSEQERLELREDVRHIIDEQVTKGLADLGKLRERWIRNNQERNDSLEQVMNMNGVRETEKLNVKLDTMVGKFLSETSESRERTHHMAWVAEEMAKELEREKKRKEKAKHTTYTWDDTNNEWDDWDDWKTCG
ncbi:unnamed protein product [Cylindrotheca closterium]|uniref:Uncharacterized protein n=1 Tax=Cylindrotheca closterium TaxID=2856 RepID=A0AAD2G9I1_9STRA|nr:unnamed protein product [Cylindrotheca closterium]